MILCKSVLLLLLLLNAGTDQRKIGGAAILGGSSIEGGEFKTSANYALSK